MLPKISKIKGVHPGALLKRELKAKGMGSTELAQQISEHKQTISAILNERRGITPALSIKLASQFAVANDYFMMLQASYEVERTAARAHKAIPDLSRFRKALFWDTDIHTFDWNKNRSAIIKRILERGNKKEIETMIAFYGREIVAKEIRAIRSSFLPSFKENARKYHLIGQLA